MNLKYSSLFIVTLFWKLRISTSVTLTKQTNQKMQNGNHQKYHISEGFKQNGLQIQIQRIFYIG